MKARSPFTQACKIPVAGLLVLSGLFSNARPASGLTQEACPFPPGVTPPADPRVPAQQVKDRSASLMDFALVARDRLLSDSVRLRQGETTLEQVTHFGCLMRQEGSPWYSSSTHLVQLTPDSRVLIQGKDMALSGRLLKPSIYAAILQALGIDVADLLSGPATASAAFAAAAEGQGGPFEILPDAAGYASVYLSANFQFPIVLRAGFDSGNPPQESPRPSACRQ